MRVRTTQHGGGNTGRRFNGYLWLLLSLSLFFAASCGGLAGEPEIVATIRPAPTSPPDVGSVDILVGVESFAENCTRCHGVGGAGDGEFALAGELPVPVPDFTDPATIRNKTPQEYFDIITNGKTETLMPFWSRLPSSERWALTMFSYTLSYQQDEVDAGAMVWEAECAGCHGDTGEGDGPMAASLGVPVPDLTDRARMSELSDQSLFETVTNGLGEAMPSFGDDLDDDQRWAVVNYARTFTLENFEAISDTGDNVAQAEESTPVPDDDSVEPPVATEEVPQEVVENPTAESAAEVDEESTSEPVAEVTDDAGVVLGTVSGTVINGTSDSGVPLDLVVTLTIFDQQFNSETFDVTVDETGAFLFEDVPIYQDRTYIVSTVYQDRDFESAFATGEAITSNMDLPIMIFDVTDDISVIQIEGIVVQIIASPGELQVVQVTSFVNTSDKVYSTNESVDGQRWASLSIPLPEGAEIIDVGEDVARYVLSDDGNTLIDTWPVVPGQQNVMHVVYRLPFDDTRSIEQVVNYDVVGSYQVLISPGQLSLSSDVLDPLGTLQLGDNTYESFGLELGLQAGDTISYEVTAVAGALDSTSTVDDGTSNNVLPVILIVVGAVSIAVAALMFFRGGPSAKISVDNNQALIDMLVEEIAELDQLRQSGDINEKAYQQQRQRLKSRLADLMQNEEN